MKKLILFICGATVLAGLCFAGLQRADAYTVDIHGYGNQDFMDAGKNQFLGARGGTWTENSMSLIFTAGVTDDTTIWARVHHHPEADATIDWLYVDKKIGTAIDIRAGQMKYPLGIYNLYAENKFLEISELEPMMYQSSVDHLIFDNFNGVDIEYSGTVGIEMFGGGHKMEEGGMIAKKVWGFRVPYKTPLDGLTVVVSSASFTEETLAAPVMKENQRVQVASLDYVNYGLDLKAEYAEKKLPADRTVRSYYVQAGYTFFEILTPYVRYDVLYTDTRQRSDPSLYQKDATFGLGYRINNYLKVKAEGHFINGYDVPVESGEVAAGTGQKSWTMFVAGVNFIF